MDIAEQMNELCCCDSNFKWFDGWFQRPPLLLFHAIKEKQINNGCNCSDYKEPLGTVHIHMGMFTWTLFFSSTFH